MDTFDPSQRATESLGGLRDSIKEFRSDMHKGFDRMEDRFDSMQRTMIIGFVTLFASIVASVIGGIIATQL